MLCHNECPLKHAHDPLTSHMMTSSPRAPPPPLTLTGATLGTKQAQRKLIIPRFGVLCPRQVQRILLNHTALNQVITAALESFLFTLNGFTQRRIRFLLTVALLLMYGAVISQAPYVGPMCGAQRETCSPVIQPAGWNYSAKLLQIDTFMSLPHGTCR